MNTKLSSFNKYNRDSIKTGIVHIGVGNFHRAHQAYYIDKLIPSNPDQNIWGICGIMLLPSDERLYKALKQQDNLYTLTVCKSEGGSEMQTIGSISELIWGVENPQAVFEKIASTDTKIISLTITEGGYNIDKQSGDFLLDNKDIAHDIVNHSQPKTVFGFVAEGLRKRKKLGAGAITILSCDNLQHNGNTAKKAFTSFIKTQDPELAEWVSKNVSFPNSMVDRITPSTTADDITRLNKQNGTTDQAPVYCEDFIQWVIEDDFMAGRPSLEKVGVEFTTDVMAYENMKLSLLNASHTMLSYPAFLAGYRKVDDAMHDSRFSKYLRTFMDKDITPYVPAPGDTNLDLYKQTLISRFGNKSVSDQLSRLCSDGISKIPVYIMPNLTKMIGDHADITRIAFLFGSYRHYLKYQIDDNGDTFEYKEFWLTDEDMKLIASDEPTDFLNLSAFSSLNLSHHTDFAKVYLSLVTEIKDNGILEVIESIS